MRLCSYCGYAVTAVMRFCSYEVMKLFSCAGSGWCSLAIQKSPITRYLLHSLKHPVPPDLAKEFLILIKG